MLNYEVVDGVAEIKIDDSKMNAFSHELLELIEEAFTKAETDDVVKVIQVMGNAKAFSAGFDLNEIKKGPEEMKRLVLRGMRFGKRIFLNEKPIVLVSHGHTLAMGAILFLAADYRVGIENPKAKVGLNESLIGITMPQFAVELARFRLSPAYIGRSLLKAEIYDMPKAKEVGYFDSVVSQADSDSFLKELTESYKALNSKAYKATKMRLRSSVISSVNMEEI